MQRGRCLRWALTLIELLVLLGIPSNAGESTRSADWPQFLGPDRNGTCLGAGLASSWPKEGPRATWQMDVGRGFAGPSVRSGKLILFHRLEDQETIDCLDATNGLPTWRFQYPTLYRDDFGFDPGPRATPTIAEDRVYAVGAEGQVHCLDFATGKLLWNLNAKEQFQAPKGFFGIACSPLVRSGKVYLNMGGSEGRGIVALDSNTGRLLWKATDDEASYASPVALTLAGKPQVLFFTRSRLIALDEKTGLTRFDFPWRARAHASVNAATPLVMGDLIFVSASYQTGAALLRVTNGVPQKVWSSDDVLSNHYATSVHRDGFLYGFHGRQEYGQSLRCVELLTGQVIWSQEGFGAGSLIGADNTLIVLKEDGQLILAAASSDGYRELGRAQILPSGVRACPALADGNLYARSKDRLVCVSLRTP